MKPLLTLMLAVAMASASGCAQLKEAYRPKQAAVPYNSAKERMEQTYREDLMRAIESMPPNNPAPRVVRYSRSPTLQYIDSLERAANERTRRYDELNNEKSECMDNALDTAKRLQVQMHEVIEQLKQTTYPSDRFQALSARSDELGVERDRALAQYDRCRADAVRLWNDYEAEGRLYEQTLENIIRDVDTQQERQRLNDAIDGVSSELRDLNQTLQDEFRRGRLIGR